MLAAAWLSMRKRWIWKGVAKYLALMTIVILVIQQIGEEHTSYRILADALTGLVVGLIGLTITFLYFLLYIPRRVRKTYTQLQLDGQHVHVECDGDEIRIQDASGFMKVAWPRLIKWTENSRFLLLYRTDLHCHYLPKDKVDARMLDVVKANLVRANVPFF